MGFPSLKQTVDRNVRQIIDTLLGRTGNAGDRVILVRDLAELGLAEANPNALNAPARPNGSITDSLKPSTGSEPTESAEQPDNPTTPNGLQTASAFGAVMVSWQPANYKGHSHTEVFRAQVDDVTQAQMVHEADQARYTDITSTTTEYFYWIRHVNKNEKKSQFNQVSGVPGRGSMVISVQDLILQHPEIATQPFTVINRGTEAAPEWVIALNSDVAVNGAVNISQLESGELKPGSLLTVGSGSLEMGTSTDGNGYLIVTGPDGIQNNDYMVIKNGSIQSFVYAAGVGHVPYKEVRRIETGTAVSGTQVKIPAYFKSQPQITLYPRDIGIYNKDYADQSQRLELFNTAPEPHPTEAGAWLFTPTARLVLSAGGQTQAKSFSQTSSAASMPIEFIETGIQNLQRVSYSGRVASSRHTGSGNLYHKRKAKVSLRYKSTLGSWIMVDEQDVLLHSLNGASFTLSSNVNNATDVKVSAYYFDDIGTFESGEPTYEYTTRQVTGSNISVTKTSDSPGWENHSLTASPPNMPGWTLDKVVYVYDLQAEVKARTGYVREWQGMTPVYYYQQGEADLKYLTKNGLQRLRAVSPSTQYTSAWADTDSVSGQFIYEDLFNKTGRVDNFVQANVSEKLLSTTDGYAVWVDSGYLSVSVTNVRATFHYSRQVQPGTTETNLLEVDTATYEKGATDVSLSNSVINWTATGE